MIHSALIEQFNQDEVDHERPFADRTINDLQRWLASDYSHAALIYGTDGAVRVIWSTTSCSPYYVAVASPQAVRSVPVPSTQTAFRAIAYAHNPGGFPKGL